MSGEIITADRSLEQVTQGILVLSAQTVANICQIGKLLTEAKSMVGHGGWEKYLEEKVSYSQSTANNFMRLYQEYGEFGPNLQTFGNLNTSQALALLALPEGKREAFAENHDVESMSVRQLKQQIAVEKKRADDAENRNVHLAAQLAEAEDAASGYPQDLDELEHKLSQAQSTADALREQLAVAQEEIGAAHQKAEDWMKQAHDWQGKAAESKKDAAMLRGDISALETDLAVARAQAGKVSPSEMIEIKDQARAEAERIVAESRREELADKDATIEELRAKLQRAEDAAEQGDEQQTLLSLAGQAASDVGSALNVLCGYYKKFLPRYPRIAEAIRSLAVKQIETIQKGFDIEPV